MKEKSGVDSYELLEIDIKDMEIKEMEKVLQVLWVIYVDDVLFLQVER